MSDFAGTIKWDLLPFINGQGLDLGCGDARPHDFMMGIDLNAGTTGRGPNMLMDARKLVIFADESQDFVFSSYLLNELEDWPKVIAEWWRVLKHNGYLILFLPLVEGENPCNPKRVIDAMESLKPWQMIEARTNENQFFSVYRKCDSPHIVDVPDPEKICAVIKLGAHGDALWASSILPHLKEQGYYVVFYTQDTGEEVLRHDPHIDRLIKFESRVPLNQLGELFLWLEAKYRNTRILVECVEGTLLPSPQKIQYHFPLKTRNKLMNFNYLEMHHEVGRVPFIPRQKFYPNEDEKVEANHFRMGLEPRVVVYVPNGSSCSKMWPHSREFASRLLENEDVSLVMLGDERGVEIDEHPRLIKIGLGWNVRRAMTFCQLADVVVGQETGLLNSVAFEKEVAKVVLMSHSSEENLTRDWPNTTTLRMMPDCAPCHQLHYDWTYCTKDEATQSAKCQAMITVDSVIHAVGAACKRIKMAA